MRLPCAALRRLTISSTKRAVRAEIIEVSAAPHQQSIADGILEMTVGAFDRAVLVRDALIVAGRRHAVVGEQILTAEREIGLCIGIEVAEGGRQAVAAVIAWCAANRPQGILKPFGQRDEASPPRMTGACSNPDQVSRKW